ncbi:hypothetical protein B0H15DRAFT_623061 [Mycena belliarum]|uniref:Brain protein I3 n=1 Tax=Mycena belliarum TaxID=1033014 RepID=A0AAD6UB29_9AGAR|nr:hypothetical protein B0H15DRAFT_623061 [Mycena belliae]
MPSSDNKTTLAFTPAEPAGPPVYTPPPSGYAQPAPQQYPSQGSGYAPQQQGYAPQPQACPGPSPSQPELSGHQPQSYPSQRSAAQVGEEYRAQLFAQCAQGIHQPTTKYGVCGIITAVVCFPIGLICLFTDTEQKCDRCGIKL